MVEESSGYFFLSTETVDNPRLAGMKAFPIGNEFLIGSDYMQNHGQIAMLRTDNLRFKCLLLKSEWGMTAFVQASFSDCQESFIFQQGVQPGQLQCDVFFGQEPGMDTG